MIGEKIRIEKLIKKRLIVYLFVFLTFLLFLKIQLRALSNVKTIGFTVELKEWVILEVLTPSQYIKSAGNVSTQTTVSLNMRDNITHIIRVFLSIPRNKTVHLRIKAHGDLINSNNEILPISNIAWHAEGEGFQDGILDKNSPQIMATWNKSGFYQGLVTYYWVKSSPPSGDFTQTITYTLVVL